MLVSDPHIARAILLQLYRAAVTFTAVRENALLIQDRLLVHAHGGNGFADGCQPPPPGLRVPSRYKDFASDWGADRYLGRAARSH